MKSSNPFHEGQACDAVLRVIEQRRGSVRHDLSFPEKTAPSKVELVCKIGDQPYAVEHTGIEPFEGHAKLMAEGSSKLQPIIDGLKGLLPAEDDFEILFPVADLLSLKGSQLGAAQKAIVGWVASAGPTLSTVESYGRQIPTAAPSLPNVPCKLALRRWTPLSHARRGAYVSPIIGNELEQLRIERITRAYDKKIKKLMACKEEGARTALVLENNEINFTNAQVVADVLNQIEATRAHKPDEIYLFDTCCRAPWWVWALRIDDTGYYALSQERKCLTELAPETLENLTGN